MKRQIIFFVMMESVAFFLTVTSGHVEGSELSPQRLNFFDKRGYFPPSFKAAVHELVDTKQALVQAKVDAKKFKESLPDLQKQSSDAEVKVASLQQELALYDHPEEKDFTTLQARMNDAGAKPEEQLMLAQAYVWAYPTNPHQTEAQQYLAQVQKKIADQQQAEKDAEAARQTARAKLLQRVAVRDLSLDEWKDFLRDMSQEDILKYLGRPQTQGVDYWIFSGSWTTDPTTGQKIGLRIDFNGTRALSVVGSSQ